MNPREFEMFVCDYFQQKGYNTQLTPFTNDWGVDAFIEKDGKKLAVQVKKYGGTVRKINREAVMALYGAKDYFDCTGAVLATDGIIMDDALLVAEKLGIEILYINQDNSTPSQEKSFPINTLANDSAFEDIWEQYIIPLEGKTLLKKDGNTNIIDRVDWGGIKRTTSNGRRQLIKIEIFKWAIQYLLTNGCVTREEINQEYTGRASSGIVLILSQVPFFKHFSNPERLVYSSFQK